MDQDFVSNSITSKLTVNEEKYIKKVVTDYVESFIERSNQSNNTSLNKVSFLRGNPVVDLINVSNTICVDLSGEWNKFVEDITRIKISSVSEALTYVKTNGLFLAFVESKFQTKKVCKEAIRNNPSSLKFVKKQTKELCLLAVSLKPDSLQFVHKKDREIIITAFSNSDCSEIRFLSKDHLTTEICSIAIKKNYSNFCRIPVEMRTDNLCYIAVSEHPRLLQYVPNQTQELVELAMSLSNYREFKCVFNPSLDLCYRAIKADPFNLSYIMKHKQTEKMCLLAVSLNPNTIEYVGKVTKKVLTTALVAIKRGDIMIQKNRMTEMIEHLIQDAHLK